MQDPAQQTEKTGMGNTPYICIGYCNWDEMCVEFTDRHFSTLLIFSLHIDLHRKNAVHRDLKGTLFRFWFSFAPL